MNKWIKGFLFLLNLTVISYCSNQNKMVQETAFSEMMDLQEQVRPMVVEVNQLYRELEQLEATVDTSNRQLLGEIDLAIRALEKAEQGMMAWINVNGGQQLEDLRTQRSHQEIMQYIEEEAQQLQKVKDLMLGSIEQSQKVKKAISR